MVPYPCLYTHHFIFYFQKMNTMNQTLDFDDWNSTMGNISAGRGVYMQMDPSTRRFAMFCWGLHKFLTPVIIVVGLVGNVTSFLVFVRTHVRRLSSSVYLAALAIADTGFLVQLFITWLNYIRIFLFHKEGWCQAVVYLSYVCSFLSVWYVVGFTVERYIAVCYPLKRQDMCTSLRAKKVVLWLAVFACIAYSFGAWTSGIVSSNPGQPPQCQPLPKYRNLVDILNNVDTVITLIIPSISIFVLNVRLATKIKYFYAKRMVMTATHLTTSSNINLNDVTERSMLSHASFTSEDATMVPASSARQRSQITITKMLLVVSTIFLLLNLPSHVIRVQAFMMGFINPHFMPSNTVIVWQQFFTIIYYTNFSVNFFLYSLCGKNFRSALRRMFLWRNVTCRANGALATHVPSSGRKKRLDSTENNTLKSFVTQAPRESANKTADAI